MSSCQKYCVCSVAVKSKVGLLESQSRAEQKITKIEETIFELIQEPKPESRKKL